MLVLRLSSDNEFNCVADSVPVLGLNANFPDDVYAVVAVPVVAVTHKG
jgi:hypothetical protein